MTHWRTHQPRLIDRDRSARLRRRLLVALFAVALLCVGRGGVAAELDPFPLKPPDTSSPRATLQSFIVNTNIAVQKYNKRAEYGTRAEWVAAVTKPFQLAVRCLDLSDVGIAFKEITGTETVLFLKEIFDRIEIPPYKDVPGPKFSEKPEKEAEGKEEKKAPTNTKGTPKKEVEEPPKDTKTVAEKAAKAEDAQEILRWRVPNTEITITRTDEGVREGEYLFSKDTVARARAFYEKSKSLSYKADAAFGIYETYIRAPGSWLDADWYYSLPYGAKVVYLNAPVWKWAMSVAIILLAVVVVVLLIRYGKHRDEKHKSRGAQWQIGQLVAIASAIGLTLFVRYFIEDQIRLRGVAIDWMKIASSVVLTVTAGWAAVVFLGWIAQSIIVTRRFSESSMDAQLVRVCTRLVTFIVIVYLVMNAAEILGIPLAPVLAGLGVGGLAVALAARPTLENFIGGIILFVDKPIRVGDFCRYGDKIGTVEEIGLRSTRIRSLERTLVSVPNADFSQLEIENFAHRDRILFSYKMELRRETTEDQLRQVTSGVHELLLADDRIDDDPCRIRLIGYGRYSVDLEIFAYVFTSDYNEYLAIREDLLLKISGVVQQAKTAFAVPVEIHVHPDMDRA